MRADQAKTIPISSYLENIEGITPAHSKMDGKELWYSSPLREGDKTPSFKVDHHDNIWFDHGLAQGGNIIDLVCIIRNTTVKEALSILERSGLYQGGYAQKRSPYVQDRPLTKFERIFAGEKEKTEEVDKSLQLISVKELSHPGLLEYIESRKIPLHIAKQYLKQVHFKPADKLVEYFALGWPNGEGFEVRNVKFKGFVGKGKDISVLNSHHRNDIIVFEGFMDFLSYLAFLETEKGITEIQATIVILNSTSLREKLLEVVTKYQPPSTYLFLDNDGAGRDALEFYKQAKLDTVLIDKSGLYSSFKDFNEKWVAKSQKHLKQ
ncbi:MAG: toprim domain-containing protein [Terasakiella sp.]|uniref:toprim domain-containing protein n=1 Tax=unclassified Terasakiella TaxID=2614952 RepID=UPI003AFFC95C